MTTLGQTIGIVRHACSVTNNSNDKTSITIGIDFTNASDSDIKSWLVGNRVIAFQRPTRSLSLDEIQALDGTTIAASDAGVKIKSRSEKIASYVNAGIPESIASAIVDGAISSDKMLAIQNILDEKSSSDESENDK